MKAEYRFPHIEKVEVPREHVLRLFFDDGLVGAGFLDWIE
jgi:hypothetical protein